MIAAGYDPNRLTLVTTDVTVPIGQRHTQPQNIHYSLLQERKLLRPCDCIFELPRLMVLCLPCLNRLVLLKAVDFDECLSTGVKGMKSYLRYEPARCFGVITSPDANAIFDFR